MCYFQAVWVLVQSLVASRAQLMLENLALRQQLAVYQRENPRPHLSLCDRLFWVELSKIWDDWKSALVIVQPETVIRWHKELFKRFWNWKSRNGTPGRPPLAQEIIDLIRRLDRENPTWGTPRIKSELALLGHDVAESTITKYRVKVSKPPSQTWRTFLKNHMDVTAAMDFFTVPTATFNILYCLILLSHDRRKVVHFAVTANPSSAWVAQQLKEAFPFDTAPRYLLHDNDSIFGEEVQRTLQNMGIEEVKTAPHSPWQNPYVERLIGSIRRECLDHMIVLGERHLLRILRDYFHYYHTARCHLSLDRNAPEPRQVEPPWQGEVVAIPHLGGLHHRYTRAA